jgi:hypothetical protein
MGESGNLGGLSNKINAINKAARDVLEGICP